MPFVVRDPSSFASMATAGGSVRRASLNLRISPEDASIAGAATLAVVVQKPGVGEAEGAGTFVLDTRALAVQRVCLETAPARELAFSLGVEDAHLGTPLSISLPPDAENENGEIVIKVQYACSPECSAVQFLKKEQTLGKSHPYVFTQCQAIHARSLFPCMDSPGVKFTYEANVSVPAPLSVAMAALPQGVTENAAVAEDGSVTEEDGWRTFHFKQPTPVPAYLVAFAAGNLAKKAISERIDVYCEPEGLEEAHAEFAPVAERYLVAAEDIAGPYTWGRCDLLVLPFSFPYGGMENPCLTFVTPSILSGGDGSQTHVIAHEIAHSWTGNLVSCASWEHFWLNEGFTVFLERKILARIAADDAASSGGDAKVAHAREFGFQALGGAQELKETVGRMGPDHRFTCLVPDLSTGEDPDDAFSKIPYEKGFYTLVYLELCVGGDEEFNPFFKAWLATKANMSVHTEEFKTAYLDYFNSKVDLPRRAVLESIDWNSWLHKPGLPPLFDDTSASLSPHANYDATLRDGVMRLASYFHHSDIMGIGTPPASAFVPGPEGDPSTWPGPLVVAFLTELSVHRASTPLHMNTLPLISSCVALSPRLDRNLEVQFLWLKLRLRAGDSSALDGTCALLRTCGRMKYVRPLFQTLISSKVPEFRERASTLFEEVKGTYHPIASKMVSRDLQCE